MERYEITVAGHIEMRRARALGCQAVEPLTSGDSLLSFAAVDQAALYGLLGRLRDARLELIAIRRLVGAGNEGSLR